MFLKRFSTPRSKYSKSSYYRVGYKKPYTGLRKTMVGGRTTSVSYRRRSYFRKQPYRKPSFYSRK